MIKFSSLSCAWCGQPHIHHQTNVHHPHPSPRRRCTTVTHNQCIPYHPNLLTPCNQAKHHHHQSLRHHLLPKCWCTPNKLSQPLKCRRLQTPSKPMSTTTINLSCIDPPKTMREFLIHQPTLTQSPSKTLWPPRSTMST